MRLPFLNRENERGRLERAIQAKHGTFCCVYGRRRCGKSRLLNQVLDTWPCTYYVADERDGGLQREELANAAGEMVPGFGDVVYPGWSVLLQRWWAAAPDGAALVIDEFPYLASASPELPSLLQKMIDREVERPVHLILCGSSQRMMQGLVLDQSAPLYGRAREIVEVRPLGARWMTEAFPRYGVSELLRTYAAWGGVPRYWELAREFESTMAALSNLALDPLGVLHQEPERILRDDMRETVQASSILTLVGRGCSRLSEIAARLNKPATSLTRPVSRLVELGLVRREFPFGSNPKSSKKTLYFIDDPFLAMWYRYVEPSRSRLQAGALQTVAGQVAADYPNHVGRIWEELVRQSVARLRIAGQHWLPGQRWWGQDTEGRPMETDLVAESADGSQLLVGECKLNAGGRDLPRLHQALRQRAARLPFAGRYQAIHTFMFVGAGKPAADCAIPPESVLAALT